MIFHALRLNIVRASSKRYSCWNFLRDIRCTASIEYISLTAERLFGTCIWCLTWRDVLLSIFWLLDCCDVETTCLFSKCCESITITAWFSCLGAQCSTVFFLFAKLSMKCLAKFTINLTCSAFYCLSSSEIEKSSLYSFAMWWIVSGFPSICLNWTNRDFVYSVLPFLFWVFNFILVS